MLKPKIIRKKKELLDAIYLDYKNLQYLKSNSCIGVLDKIWIYKITDKI